MLSATTVLLKENRYAIKLGNSRIADYVLKDDGKGNIVVRNEAFKKVLMNAGLTLISEKKSSHGDYLKYRFTLTEKQLPKVTDALLYEVKINQKLEAAKKERKAKKTTEKASTASKKPAVKKASGKKNTTTKR